MGLDLGQFRPLYPLKMTTPSRPARFWTLSILAGAAVITYLFATAPKPLSDSEGAKPSMSTQEAFKLMALENDHTRTLFTQAIVGQGKKQGLVFDENWADDDIHAGPLPALFLRGVALALSESEVPLRLFLGSDFPIESNNLLKGHQAEAFLAMKASRQAQHFRDAESGEFVSMFPDYASAAACVSCHNEHINSPKTDWALGDMMGATTWAYPSDSITSDEFIAMLKTYREGVAVVWDKYLDELQHLDEDKQPEIGHQWPEEGLFIPNKRTLRDSIDKLVGPELLAEFMSQVDKQ